MGSLNTPISLAELISRAVFITYPDDPANDPPFDQYRPRFDGDSPANMDIICGAMLRVSSWTLAVDYTTELYTFVSGTGYTGQGAQPGVPLTCTLAGVTPGSGAYYYPGGDEASSVISMFGASPRSNVGLTKRSPAYADVAGNPNSDTSLPCYGQLILLALMNGNAANGRYPVYFTFSLDGGINIQLNGQPCSPTFVSAGDYAQTSYPQGVDAISFVGQKFNMVATPRNGQASGEDGSYTLVTPTAITLTPKEYFTWGGLYNSSTGAPAM